MKKQNYSELSTEALQKQLKTTSVLSTILAGALIVLFVASIIVTILKGFSPTLVVALCLLPILILNFKNIANMKKELESRKKLNGIN